MPICYRIDPKQKIVYITAEGILTDDELKKHVDNLLSDADYHPGFNRLSDFRAVSLVDLTGSGMRGLAQGKGTTNSEGSMRALVVSSDLAYGMARMFQILTDDSSARIEVFKEITEARKWLGLE